MELPSEQELQDLKNYFEFEYCSDCGGDWYDHDIVGLLGNPFYLCKVATFSDYHVRIREKLNKKERAEIDERYNEERGILQT